MSEGEWSEDPYFTSPPDDEQIHTAAQLLVKIEYMGRHGVPLNGTAVNDLVRGVWEFKHGWHRIAYFDTPGDGTYVPKPRISDRREVDPDCRDDYWWYPEMDSVLRLTNGWAKTDQKAPQEEIELSLVIREEDVEHDR